MDDNPVSIPDHLPADFLDEHMDVARRKVASSRTMHGAEQRSSRPHPTPGEEPDDGQRRLGHRRSLGDRAVAAVGQPRPSDLPVATAATALAVVGVTALTGVWGWLAVTRDPMWWAFTAVGVGLVAALARLMAVLRRRSRMLTTVDHAPDAEPVSVWAARGNRPVGRSDRHRPPGVP